VTPERTTLEWVYDPVDLFEAPYQRQDVDFDLLVDAGRAVATLHVSQDPVLPDVEERVSAAIASVFLVHQIQIRRRYHIDGPRTYQYVAGRTDLLIQVSSAVTVFTAGHVDRIETDAAGNIVRDSRAERIAAHRSELDFLAPKLGRSTTLRSMCESYARSITDPNNELVHLFEICDALTKHYSDKQAALNALSISQTKWQRLGILANVKPLEEGRHRGKHPTGRRAATARELQEARQLAWRWIMAFAQTV
jgi:hypothetical protein